ncbi:MAG TPA: type VI secretion system tube protein TssD [Acidobacteriaceae bacterium]|jgi:type VI secretion system secreted protein Hcp
MAQNAYLTVAGQKQGQITGGVTIKGREGNIEVHAFSETVLSPRDASTGLPTGKRQHTPVMIVKAIDRSSPLLLNALVNNENLTTWVLKFFGNDASGKVLQIYSITLTNASIASITQSLPDTSIAANASLPLREEITFTYQKIQWTWMDGAITAQDDWQAPVT